MILLGLRIKFPSYSRLSFLSVITIFLFAVSLRCLGPKVLCFLVSMDLWILLYLLRFEFRPSAIFLSEPPLLKVEGLQFSFGDCSGLKLELEA